jgi:hypothetical protein
MNNDKSLLIAAATATAISAFTIGYFLGKGQNQSKT